MKRITLALLTLSVGGIGCGREVLETHKLAKTSAESERTSFELGPNTSFILGPNLITANNRNAVTMMGGWNPTLRSGAYDMDDGTTWFAAESGQDVMNNSSMVYYRKETDGWHSRGSVWISARVQQNMATLSNGRFLLSYGVNENTGWLMRCWFDTLQPGYNQNHCNAVSAGGVLVLSSNSNYLGAAMDKNGRQYVWWTSVGSGGSAGSFSYIYANKGKGFNGPFTSGLGGFNSIGYTSADFDGSNYLRLAGEAHAGEYPSGYFRVLTTTLKAGNAVVWHSNLVGSIRPTDLKYDAATGDTYVMATTTVSSPTVAASISLYKFSAQEWLKQKSLSKTFPNSVRLRFSKYRGSNIILRDNSVDGKIDMFKLDEVLGGTGPAVSAEPIVRLQRPAEVHTNQRLTAIWTYDHTKQINDGASRPFSFAICGAFSGTDNMDWSYEDTAP